MVWDESQATPPMTMIELSQLNADRLKNSYWESQLKKIDPALYIRYDEIKNRWAIYEFYPENRWPKFLFWLEDRQGSAIEYDDNFVRNKLNVMHINWAYKNDVGTNKWFDELEEEADRQKKEMESKIAEESRYMFKHDKLQWRKGSRELLNRPGSDVFAGFQYQGGKNVKLETVVESTEVSGAGGSSVQPDSGTTQNPGR